MPPVSEVDLEAVPAEAEGSAGLSRSDCLCPVCLEIFLEPVTLPCSHTFCKACFLETVDKANMCCPLCRKRVSTWARLNGRNKTMVNGELWRRVQETFPRQCQRRISGLEEEEDEEDASMVASRPRVSQPGEVRREYEAQISKLVEEKRALEEAERRASEEYIQRLLAEEEGRLAEEKRRQEEQQLEDDERLARLLSEELNSTPMSEAQRNARPIEVTPAKKKPLTGVIEKFLSPVSHKQRRDAADVSPTSSLMANKENILDPPMTFSSPRAEGVTPDPPMPVLEYYGRASTSRSDVSSTAEPLPTHSAATHAGRSAKRKSSALHTEVDGPSEQELAQSAPPGGPLLQEDFLREEAQSAPPGGPVPQEDSLQDQARSASPRGPLLQELVLREEALSQRRRQEEEDRVLALRLQRQLDREEAQRAVNRSKGSADGYQLRQKTPEAAATRCAAAGPGPEETSKAKRPRPSSSSRTSSAHREEGERAGKRLSSGSPAWLDKTPPQRRGSSPSSATGSAPAAPGTHILKGRKQATLTEMFSR